MSGCGFGKPSSAQRVAAKKWPNVLLVERAIEAGPRLAGGDAEQVARRVQFRQHFAHAREQRYRRSRARR